jgi:hypothetical protein
MKTKTLNPLHKAEQWFLERIGKTIVAKSPHGFNGEMVITDGNHAKYLMNVCQPVQGYTFTDPDKRYMMAPTNTVQLGDKPVSISILPREVPKEQFTKYIDDFIEGSKLPDKEKERGKEMIWTYLNDGKEVTIDRQTLSIEKNEYLTNTSKI